MLDILGTWGKLGLQEKRVLHLLAQRLLKGQQQYGQLDLRTDKRDWKREKSEELADAMIYDAIEEVASSLRVCPNCNRVEHAEWCAARFTRE